jgi:metallo-beta-lactamase class B
MKIKTILSLLGLICAFNLVQSQPKLQISHLTEQFYVYTTFKNLKSGPYPSNSMYLVTEKGVVLFDTPWDTTQFQPLLDSIEWKHHKKVVLALVTHFHDDRSAGLQFFKQKGIQTYSSKLTVDLSKKLNKKLAQYYFTKDTLFKVGDYQFKTFYPGAGHTEDNLLIWFEKQRILYGGCFIKSTENSDLGNIADANLKEWKVSISKVQKKFPNPNYVITGHFDWHNPQSIIHTQQLLEKYLD